MQNKLFAELSVEERIELFWEEFEQSKKYPAKQFYDWHNKLTGSCEMGRNTFVKDNGINLENDSYTVNEFIEMTKSGYGSEIIEMLRGDKND